MKTVVTISRKWNNPQIKTTISKEGIELQISIEDFEVALLEEIGSVTFTLTKGQLKDKVNKAILNVLTGIKEESIKVV